MQEQMRNADRAMTNIESHPEGFNALRRVYETIQVCTGVLLTLTLSVAMSRERCGMVEPKMGQRQSLNNMFLSAQEPLQNAQQSRAAGDAAANPFLSLFQPPGGVLAAPSAEPATSGAPNVAPLPNPWAPPASGNGPASSAPAAGVWYLSFLWLCRCLFLWMCLSHENI